MVQDNIREIFITMQLHYTDILHHPIYLSVCRTITFPVQPVWPIVLHGKMPLHFSVQCRSATQLIPHLSTRNPQVLFCAFPTCRPANLPARCWCYILQEDSWLPQFSYNQVYSYIHPKTTHYDTVN